MVLRATIETAVGSTAIAGKWAAIDYREWTSTHLPGFGLPPFVPHSSASNQAMRFDPPLPAQAHLRCCAPVLPGSAWHEHRHDLQFPV